MNKFTKVFIVLILLFTLCSCSHKHRFANVYTTTDTHHYYKCEKKNCNEQHGLEEHIFDKGVVSEEGTSKITTYTCQKCSYQYTDTHHHIVEGEVFEFNASGHWYECECGEKMQLSPHEMGEWVIEVEPTEEIKGKKYQKCLVCEYRIEEEIPVLEHHHEGGNNLQNDEISHWYECRCGEKMQLSSHEMGEWVIEVEPTEEIKGKRYQKCLVCEYRIEEEIPVLEHHHERGNNLQSDEISHWYECRCGERVDIQKHNFEKGIVIVPSTPDNSGKIKYQCSVCEKEKIVDSKPISVNYLDINSFNEVDELPGIKLMKFNSNIENNDLYHKVLLEKVGSYCKVTEIIEVGENLTGWYDYVLMASPEDLTGEYDKLIYYLNIDDYVVFSESLEILSTGKVDITLYKTIAPETFKIEYDLGYDQFDTKEDLYKAYFTEFYYFLKTKTDCDLESYDILNEEDFLRECLNWNFGNTDSFKGVGNAFSKYYLTIKVGDTLANQPTDTFIGYCYQNNKFRDFIEHLEVFFAYWRTDEGYTNSTNNGNDFFASAWAALVDTCKFFYFTSDTLTDTYSWFTKERSPRVHYMLDNIPGVGYVSLIKESIGSMYLPTISRKHYRFLGWYTEDGEKTSIVSSNTKVKAKWERILYNVEFYILGSVKTCQVKAGLRISIPNFNTSGYSISGYIDESGEKFDIWNAIEKDEKIFVTLNKNNQKNYNLYLILNDGNPLDYKYVFTSGEEYTLPVPVKNGYDFGGWYNNPDFKGNPYESIVADEHIILYAKWVEKEIIDDEEDKENENTEITKEEVLAYISDVVTSNTVNNLPDNINGVAVTYTSSNPKLYTIEKGTGYTNRRYQTHKQQKVTVYASLASGTSFSKEITIDPVTYSSMEHPKAVYFSVSSASSYKKYSERYQKEQTLFSDKFKNNMDMVYYAFAIPQTDGTLTLNTTYLEEIIELKNHGIRVLMVIDGANAAPLKAMVKLCDNSSTRATFVQNILELVTKYNFDGVDVDWEFPGILSSQAGYEKYTTAVDIKNLNSLLKELREGFNALQDSRGSNYLLTVATPPTDWGTDRFDYATINKYCDYVNMMSYDLNKSNVASHLTHIYQPSNSYSYKFCCDFGVSYYTSLGLDKSKIILGSAAYGKAYKVSGSTPNSKLPGLGMSGTLGQVSGYGLAGQSITWNSGTIYYTGIQSLINTGKFTQYNEYNNSGKLVGSYLYNATDKYFITYDSVLSVREKCQYAKNNKGMGIMVWAYGEDATDTIVNTICDNL